MVKKILRSIIIIALSIYLSSQILKNIHYSSSLNILLSASLVLAIFEYLVKPIVKLLLLPITILTLGLTKILINTLGLYFSTYFIDDFVIDNINLINLQPFGISIPNIKAQGFIAYMVTSVLINIVYNLLSKILIKVKKIK